MNIRWRQWQGDRCMAAAAMRIQQLFCQGKGKGMMAPDQHTQGKDDAMVASPQRGQGRGTMARQWRPWMINAGRARGVQRRRSTKAKQTKMD
jgi:hypothetical protein